MLIGATYIRRYNLENNAVIDPLSCRIAEGRKVDVLDLDAAGFEVNHATIGRHLLVSREPRSVPHLGVLSFCTPDQGRLRAQLESTILAIRTDVGMPPKPAATNLTRTI